MREAKFYWVVCDALVFNVDRIEKSVDKQVAVDLLGILKTEAALFVVRWYLPDS